MNITLHVHVYTNVYTNVHVTTIHIQVDVYRIQYTCNTSFLRFVDTLDGEPNVCLFVAGEQHQIKDHFETANACTTHMYWMSLQVHVAVMSVT